MRNLWAACAVLALLPSSPSRAASSPLVVYYGGHVVSNVNVVLVFWGPGVDSTVVSEIPAFYAALVDSSYLDWVSEYSTVGLMGAADGLAGSNQRIGRGTFQSTHQITPSTASTTLTVTQVGAELDAQVTAGNLPAPIQDSQGFSNTVYMVHFPSTIVLNLDGAFSCEEFCTVHDTFTVGGVEVGVGMIPDFTETGCSTGCGTDATSFNNVTAYASQTLLNIVTDVEIGLAADLARPIAWYDSQNGEVGDICNQVHGAVSDVSGYVVNKGWSNRLDACIASPGTALPVCNGSTTYCRQCSAADDGQVGGCTGSTAACEVETASVAFGECVACAANSDCTGTTPVCSKAVASNDTCAACATDSDCTGNSAGTHCLASGACGAGAVVIPDAGPGTHSSGSSSGCSSTGGAPLELLPMFLAVAGLIARRRSGVSEHVSR